VSEVLVPAKVTVPGPLTFCQLWDNVPVGSPSSQLALRYNITEFPTVVVLSPAGEELGRVGYVPGEVEKFAAAVNALLVKSRSSSP